MNGALLISTQIVDVSILRRLDQESFVAKLSR
jgi:hypothetical protein